MLSFGGANRDPSVYDEPDRFDIERDPKDLLVFGNGPHFCLGANLARTEMRCMVDAILDASAIKPIIVIQADEGPHLPDSDHEKNLVERGQLIVLLQNFQPVDEGIWALYPHNRHLSPKVRVLVDYLSEHLG